MKRVRSHEDRLRTQCKEDLKVNKGLLTLAGVSLAMAVAVPAHALDTDSIPAFTRATYNLAQAYPCQVGAFPTGLGISDLRVWAGSCGDSTNISLTPQDVAAGQALGGAT